MSFSGLKTAVLTLRRAQPDTEAVRADIAASFQEAVVEVLTAKLLAAARTTRIRHLVVVGGVGANRSLRERLSAQAAEHGLSVHYPPPVYCTDNGAMIALAGALKLVAGMRDEASPRYTVRPRWELA
jgi:N6-L-threonylcarbamoyladenine synthase